MSPSHEEGGLWIFSPRPESLTSGGEQGLVQRDAQGHAGGTGRHRCSVVCRAGNGPGREVILLSPCTPGAHLGQVSAHHSWVQASWITVRDEDGVRWHRRGSATVHPEGSAAWWRDTGVWPGAQAQVPCCGGTCTLGVLQRCFSTQFPSLVTCPPAGVGGVVNAIFLCRLQALRWEVTVSVTV